MNPPRVQFLIGGMQKCGTSALAHYLGRHPEVALPQGKEAHVFDTPDFEDDWPAERIDERYCGHFRDTAEGVLHGDATPIYAFHPRLVNRVARYNPAMRWIILLREPAERALSQFFMERARGSETWALLPALLCERWRLRGHEDDFSDGSPLRHHAYRRRGDYARQLDAVFAQFPVQQVLLLKSGDLRHDPAGTTRRACEFLDIAPPEPGADYPTVFAGDLKRPGRGSLPWRLLRLLMRRERASLLQRYGIGFD